MGKLFPKSKTFYKVYIINIGIMICFVCVFSFICTRFSTDFIIKNTTEFNLVIADDKREVLDGKIQQMEEIAGMVAAGNDAFHFIISRDDSYATPIKMRDIINYLQNICSSYSLVEEISLIDYERGIVLTDKTKMSLDEINYQEILELEALSFSEVDGEVKIRYIKNLKPVYGYKPVSIVLTLSTKAFGENLFLKNNEDFQEYIVTPEGVGLAADHVLTLDKESWDIISKTQENSLNLNHNQIVYKCPSKVVSLTVLRIQNYTDLAKEENRIASIIMVVCGLVIAVASFILYLFSLYYYRPLRRLSDHISKMKILQKGKEDNEYYYIKNAVQALQDEKIQITKKYNEALPALIQDTSHKLITEHYEEEAFQYLLNILKREMNYSKYVLLLLECSQREQVHELEEVLRGYINNQPMEAIYTDLNAYQGIYLINTELPYDELAVCVNDWKDSTEFFRSTWCLSSYFVNRSNVNLVYFETINMLKSKFFKGDNVFIFEAQDNKCGSKSMPEKKIEQNLLENIKAGKAEKAITMLHDFTSGFTHNQADVQYTCFIYFRICSVLIRDLKEGGLLQPKEYDEKIIFSELFCAESIQELERITEKIIEFCAESRKTGEEMYSANVRKTIEFIRNNYTRDLSLEEISSEVMLSMGYLSNIFKEETGCTLMEYVTYIRMRKAKDLLFRLPHMKIKEIAGNLGYNNVQSFTRCFKLYYGETPIDYKKRIQEDAGTGAEKEGIENGD